MYLLDRLYQLPKENGKITIGGVDIQDIDLSYLRKNIGIVLQEPFLFSKSFRESIADGAPRAVFQQVEELKAVGLTVPETTELLWELRKAGLDVSLDALSDEECAQELYQLLNQGVTP